MQQNQFSKESLEEALFFSKISDSLLNLSECNYKDTVDFIVKNECFKKDTFLQYIFLAINYRPKVIDLLTKLIFNIFDICKPDKNLYESIKKYLFTPIAELSNEFITEKAPNQILFMRKCYDYGIFDFNEVYNFAKILRAAKREYRIQLSYIYIYFIYEFEQKDHQFSLNLCIFTENKMKHYIISEYFQSILKKKSIYANNSQIFQECIKYGYPLNTIEGAIVTDNIDAVQEFINQESFDINQKIKPSLYDTNSLKYDEATLIQLAALHGSENSFKYLYLNGGEINNKKYTKWSTSQFAVAGGNLEIIHFLEQNDINFDNTLFIAALFHHHHIFDWLCKNMNQKLQYCNDNKNVIFDCVKANNMIDFLKCIDMGCDINICIKGVFIFYLVIHHLLKQYCIIILIF